MFCHKCGEKLVEGALFCNKCGAKLPKDDGLKEHVQQTEVKNSVKEELNLGKNKKINKAQNPILLFLAGYILFYVGSLLVAHGFLFEVIGRGMEVFAIYLFYLVVKYTFKYLKS